MNIEHLAIWVEDIEKMSSFYTRYFKMKKGEKYVNSSKNFSSYFLSFENGCRLELMHRPDIIKIRETSAHEYLGIAHFAISVGSEQAVIHLTNRMEKDGIPVVSQPRKTADGYFESVILDPEYNRVEITI